MSIDRESVRKQVWSRRRSLDMSFDECARQIGVTPTDLRTFDESTATKAQAWLDASQ